MTTVFFDVGGTLLDSGDLFETIARKLVQKQPEGQTYQLVKDTFMGIYVSARDSANYLGLEETIAATLGLLARDHGFPDLTAQAHDIYYETFLDNSRLFPETMTVLKSLQRNNCRMIIAGDADSEIMQAELVKQGLTKYFTDVILSGAIKCYKPSMDFIKHLTKYVNPVESCYFVGDNEVDIESGRRLGIKSVLVDRKNSGQKSNADFVIHDLRELLAIVFPE